MYRLKNMWLMVIKSIYTPLIHLRSTPTIRPTPTSFIKTTGNMRDVPMTDYLDHFMGKTIDIARKNPVAPYGAIIVYDNKDILLESVNSAHHHPLMHGELSVIHNLFEHGFDGDRGKLSIYTTAEPCPMCAAAI